MIKPNRPSEANGSNSGPAVSARRRAGHSRSTLRWLLQ